MNFKKKLLTKSLILAGLILSFPKTALADSIMLDREKTEGVNVRSEKSNYAEILGGIEDFKRYEIKAEDKFWYTIEFEGEKSYVGKDWFYRLKDVKVIKTCDLKTAPDKNAENKNTYSLFSPTKLTILDFVEGGDYVKVAYNPSEAKNKKINIDENDKLKDKDVDMDEQIGFVKLSNLDLSKRDKKYIEKLKENYKKLNETKEKYKKLEEEESQEDEVVYEVIYVTYFTDDDGEVIKSDDSQIGKSIYNYALDYVGSPYVFGGVSKENGIDCSGLVLRAYENFGLALPHLAKSQADYGKIVAFGEEKAGDLVFFGSSYDNIYHVGIADGMGNMVHAASPGQGVIVSPINNPFVIKRIFE